MSKDRTTSPYEPRSVVLTAEEIAVVHDIRCDIEARIKESIDSNGMEMGPSQIAEWSGWSNVLRRIALCADPEATCPVCHNTIQPDVCHCGAPTQEHTIDDGHSPVPMGCDCGRDSDEAPL